LNKRITPTLRERFQVERISTVSADGNTATDESAGLAVLQDRLAARADWRLRAGGVIAAWNVFQPFPSARWWST